MQQNAPSKRLVALLIGLKNEKGISFAQMAKDTDYSPQSINKLTKGLQNAPVEMIDKFCKTYKLNSDFIYKGNEYGNNDTLSLVAEHKVPFYEAYLTAGIKKQFGDNAITPAYFISMPYFIDCDFGLKVSGDSMYPRYPNGAVVVCKTIKDKSIILYGEAYVINTTEYTILKYIQNKDEKHVVLRSENPKHDPVVIPRSDILNLHLVKGKIEMV
jgi:SOS-response transcriptional repressor LexA